MRGLSGVPQAVSGWVDHAHLFVGLKATHSLADFLRELKKAGTAWVHNEIGMPDFTWQEGTPHSQSVPRPVIA